MHDLFLFFSGLILVVLGAEGLVRGASSLAKMMGISPLVIGLTIIGYGTSSPELAVSSLAAFKGEASISLGNILGSNIFNLLGILGLMATIKPLKIHSQIVYFDLPIMLGVTVILAPLMLFHKIPGLLGIPLLLLLIAYTYRLVRVTESAPQLSKSPFALSRCIFSIAGLIGGLILLIFGAEVLITGAVGIGRAFGLSELVIGLTLVAIGTSIPELATSLVALYKKETDLAVGNIIGSNIYNILAILGISLLLSKDGLEVPEESFRIDLPFLVFTSFLAYFLLRKTHQITRGAGLLFLSLYVSYVVFLIAF